MAIRKIKRLSGGRAIIRFQLDYFDADGTRVKKNFEKRADADAERVRIEGELSRGTHTADSKSRTLIAALRAWLDHGERKVTGGLLEAGSLRPYRNHVDHIARQPIAALLLSRFGTPACQAFADDLEIAVSPAMATKILRSLRMGLGFAQRKGWIANNPASAAKLQSRKRHKIAIEIPSKDELRRIMLAARLCDDAEETRFGEALVTAALFSGLRISELLGLGRQHVALAKGKPTAITVERRADERRKLGAPKTATSRRVVPIGPTTATVIAAWLLRMPVKMRASSEIDGERFVFPSGAGNVESYGDIYNRVWTPILIVAGVVDANGGPKFGLHALRHAAASVWIEQGLKPKQVQARMGHASLQMTMDLYGHLWPDETADEATALASERVILGEVS